ncbi:uncharacterized protein LOC123539332 isoform X2 [Mercenaria mercenaria]|uniref:uncharacterized protein LOC123539332 isoform X2 n=1 Tax=Mercenaria mercenaria TaxID=6596 RepID=UPI00234EFFE7|nr:uncharacterized protein LOC123539332 isoform X2 [Mercenaria mercenaria]
MSSGRHKFKEEFNKSVNVLGKDNYGHYNDSEMNTEESDGKRPYNKSTDVTYEKLTPTVDVTSMYDTINSDDVGNKEQVANMAKQYGYTTDSESDNFKCSTGIETRMKTLAGNQVRNRNTDIAYETLASTNDTSNEYDKIRSGIDDNALERHSSEENTKVYTNMILNATDLNLTESNPDTAKSFEVWTKTESPKALTSEYESLTLQNLSNQDEYNTINGVDRKKIRTAFASRKTRLICIFLVIAILVITTVITTLVFTVFKNENVEKCISLIAPENGFIDDKNKKGSLVVGTEITISCMEGYFVDGNDTVVCYLNRTWSESPACEIRDCGIPSDIKNGYIDDLENTTVNSTFTVKCDEGYIKVGVETVTCDMNGTWRELPNCRPVSCGIPQVLDNETVIVNNVTTFGTTANFRCIEGFSLTSASFATCLSNGSWTQIPSCFKTIGAACEEAEVLYDLVRRSRIYQADGVQGSDPFVDDEYLSPDWYSVIFNGEQYIMPDVNSMPQYNFCGTENPIYLKGPYKR